MTAPAPATRHGLVARTVAAHGLAGSMLCFPDRPLADAQFRRLMTEVRSQRLSGMLWRAVVDGALPTTTAQAGQVEWLHVESLAGALALERLLLDTTATLSAAGIPVRVLKGSALAHLDYPDPSWRTFGDIDLLVRGQDFDHAVQVIGGSGHRRLYPEPRPGFDRRFTKGTSFRTADELEIDLHRTFAMGPFGVKLDVAALWRDSVPFRTGGRTLQALPPEERLMHACYHAILGGAEPRLVPLRDLAQLMLTRDLDYARLHALIRSSGGEAVVARAVRHAWAAFEIADVLALSSWADAHRTDSRQVLELGVYSEGSNYARTSMAAVRALPRLRDRAAFVYALAAPERSYIEQRHRGRWARLRTGLGLSSAPGGSA